VFAVSDINVLPAAAAIEAKRSEAKVYSFFSDPSTLEAMAEGKPIGAVLDVNLAETPLVAMDQLLGFFEKETPIDKNALSPKLLAYSIVTPENAPPEGEVVYPLPTTLQPWLEKWEKEYPLK
jgi:ABC-type sugar transport system substrate-binding protein